MFFTPENKRFIEVNVLITDVQISVRFIISNFAKRNTISRIVK